MEFEDCLTDVLDLVLARDLPDEAYGQVLADEAELLAGPGVEGR
ncbi:hypothetical protein [Ramlibacter aurantiacus]|nr:hypothetical protein [Ramlibacter aurantiacus]